MKIKLISAAFALGALALAGAAQAQTTTGTVTINGSVAPKCTASTFSATQTITELASSSTGQLDPALIALTAGTTPYTSSFQLICNGSNASVGVTSTALARTPSVGAPTGYVESVGFTGQADIKLITAANATSTLTVTDATTAGSGSGSFTAGKFLQNVANNVVVSTYGFTSAAGILVAGSYTGSIVVTITPS